MITRACYQCNKESNAFLVFFKPRGWIKHKSPDGIDMLFCSLACFEDFKGVRRTDRSEHMKKPNEVEEEQLLATVAR